MADKLARDVDFPPSAAGATRRDVLKILMFSTIGAVGAQGLAACSLGSPEQASSGNDVPPARPIGILNIAGNGEPLSLDPTVAADRQDLGIIANSVYEGLTRFSGDTSDIEGSLAAKFESSPDAREWTFTLNPGVKFHDGEPLTSTAVRKSYEYYGRTEATWANLVPKNAKYDDSDPNVIRITSQSPMPDLGRNSTFIRIISPKLLDAGPDAVKKTPTGTGPYKFISYTVAQNVVLSANTEYRGPGPYLEQIRFQIIPDASARAAALKSGSVDLVLGMTPSDSASLKSDPSLVVSQKLAWTQDQLIFFLSGTGPASNIKVRQAISFAIDRNAIVKSILGGVAQAADSIMPPGLYGYKAPSTQYPVDLDRAKQLINESGLPTPINMEIVWAPGLGANLDRVEEAISGMVQKIGINLTVTQEPIGQVSKELADPAHIKYHAICGDLGWVNGGPFVFETQRIQAISGFKAADDLVEQMSNMADGPERSAVIAQIQEKYAQELPAIPLYTVMAIDAHKSSVHGYKTPQDGFAPNYGVLFL
ncbi:ABC transporter substrate-binding protein [Amycolatopsis sp.]|uniref:ABC transporter substrate-binding protein n=1 Tax=Amycolatopsis sp. TaxID=37632 RepID=UPI002CA4FA30|nr:ABC transporter substrate-binding protein [Amycolatopsis sp.]HVV11195.1 ABC transporter substrate-binding protein [Amycolatopsis sp.]